jgi:CMP-N-acetylneuraminic acid synthetase
LNIDEALRKHLKCAPLGYIHVMIEILKPRVVAIMIGRGGSSMKDKNVTPVLGHPILHWGASAAKSSLLIDEYYISSDSDRILTLGSLAGYVPIKRPAELATSTARGIDAVRHAMSFLPKAIDGSGIVLVQHANCATITTSVIDECLRRLIEDPTLSAVVPGHLDNDHHPFRAKKLLPDGTLESFFDDLGDLSSNRQELPRCVFLDHSIWAVRVSSILKKDGESPWPELGRRVKVVITSGSFDIHVPSDIQTTESWLVQNNISAPTF